MNKEAKDENGEPTSMYREGLDFFRRLEKGIEHFEGDHIFPHSLIKNPPICSTLARSEYKLVIDWFF